MVDLLICRPPVERRIGVYPDEFVQFVSSSNFDFNQKYRVVFDVDV